MSEFEVIRALDPADLFWPRPGEAAPETGFGCNREYIDLRQIGWREVQRILTLEKARVADLFNAANFDDAVDQYQDDREQRLNDGDFDDLDELDLGVNACVCAISASRCIPVSSCNGGEFGGDHKGSYPHVAFCLRPQLVNLFLSAASDADVGLENSGGYALVYGPSVVGLLKFAEGLWTRRAQIRKVKFGRASRPANEMSHFKDDRT